MIETDHIYRMDCLEGMKQIADNSIDAVIADMPQPCGGLGQHDTVGFLVGAIP